MQLKAATYEQYLELVAGSPSMNIKDESKLIIERFRVAPLIQSRFAPVTFLVDFSTRKYIYVDESCFDLLGFSAGYFLETDIKEYLNKFDPAYYEITNYKIFPDNLNFLKSIPLQKYTDYVFSYNYKIINRAEKYITVLQRFSFVPGNEIGKPSGIIGVIFDITHFKNDNTIVHTIEETNRYNDEIVNKLIYKKIHPIYEISTLQQMSKRELQILQHLADGLSSKQIAGKLQISVNTVSNHRKNMLKKLNCRTSSELLSYAAKHGLLIFQ